MPTFRPSLRLGLALALCAVAACSKTRVIAREPIDGGVDAGDVSLRDAATEGDLDASEEGEESAADAAPDDDAPPEEDAGMPRCANSTYTTAPSGAPCDPTRFVLSDDFLSEDCYGPPAGLSCDRLHTGVFIKDEPPAGFQDLSECDDLKLGSFSCAWAADPSPVIDDEVLEGVCAATVADPPHTVYCRRYDI